MNRIVRELLSYNATEAAGAGIGSGADRQLGGRIGGQLSGRLIDAAMIINDFVVSESGNGLF